MNPHYSLSEIDVSCRKAARGAGYSWGLAEEAGKIARWLSAYDLNGPETLAAILQQTDNRLAQFTPELKNGVWTNARGAICPVIAGAILNDYGYKIAEEQSFAFQSLIQPLAILPQAGRVAEKYDLSLVLSWDEAKVLVNAQGIKWDKRPSDSLQPVNVSCELGKIFLARQRPRWISRPVDDAVWEALSALAHRTYAPATQASRLAGAGAGLQDND